MHSSEVYCGLSYPVLLFYCLSVSVLLFTVAGAMLEKVKRPPFPPGEKQLIPVVYVRSAIVRDELLYRVSRGEIYIFLLERTRLARTKMSRAAKKKKIFLEGFPSLA